MRDRHNESFDQMVKRQFGPTAEFAGAMGTPTEPGNAEIRLDGRPIGTGPTFEQALHQAQTTAAGLSEKRPQRETPALTN